MNDNQEVIDLEVVMYFFRVGIRAMQLVNELNSDPPAETKVEVDRFIAPIIAILNMCREIVSHYIQAMSHRELAQFERMRDDFLRSANLVSKLDS